jgi:hypothetical protein
MKRAVIRFGRARGHRQRPGQQDKQDQGSHSRSTSKEYAELVTRRRKRHKVNRPKKPRYSNVPIKLRDPRAAVRAATTVGERRRKGVRTSTKRAVLRPLMSRRRVTIRALAPALSGAGLFIEARVPSAGRIAPNRAPRSLAQLKRGRGGAHRDESEDALSLSSADLVPHFQVDLLERRSTYDGRTRRFVLTSVLQGPAIEQRPPYMVKPTNRRKVCYTNDSRRTRP